MFFRHRTMITPDFGVVRGIPKNLKAFPLGEVYKNLTYAEQMRESVGENTILHQKIFFLHQTGHDGLSRFCTKIS